MTSPTDRHAAEHLDVLYLYTLQALPQAEVAAAEAQIAACRECRDELGDLRSISDAFVDWPTDVLRPPTPLWEQVARRIADEAGTTPLPAAPERSPLPEWEEVAPGISCKLLAADTDQNRVSMLVRLAPGAEYPPHRHAGFEELHLLDGELWIDERKLHPGDYNLGRPGETDRRVWSETGCTCVLVTSTRDRLL
jgi:hypothetical protein